ncbi:DUF362 domain-containing protein [Chondromyces crocatus]|uniref:DUF362 domain-containing protein n=1 Tax=Chondromyces crocatus TaxID=52 RepID=UPI00067AB967|nr:DUF362 domain-containing protein [Chondromyces crocatus]
MSASSTPAASRVVIISRPGLSYAEGAPFDPPHPVYEAVEAMFRELGLDRGRVGTPDWNPLGDLIAPGDRVVVKPNLVSQRNLHERITGQKLAASSTHGSLLRPVLDYALRAAGPRGQVRVIDAPVEGCVVEEVAGPLGIWAVIDHLRARGHDVAFTDLRTFRVVPWLPLDDVRRAGRSFNLGLLMRRALSGDPRGYRVVDLGERSFFARADAPPGSRLRFHRSHYETPVPHHTRGRHEYSAPGTVLDADVVINLPKMKTHKKTGVTLSLKSAIGLTNEKYWLPHFTEGDPSIGGDELEQPRSPREVLEDKLSRLPLPGGWSLIARAPRLDARPKIIDGSWEGNRTLWRTILDLNRILLFADRAGKLRDAPQRRYLSIVDGVVAGEGEGPLGATPVEAGLLVGGTHPALVDAVATRCMGLDPLTIVQVREALDAGLAPGGLAELEEIVDGPLGTRKFRPPRSWPSLLAAPTMG